MSTKGTFWTVAVFYLLIAFEFFYMASPFALYFYSVYGPGLSFIGKSPTLSWLSSMFLPHIVVETTSSILNLHNVFGAALAVIGFLAFCIGAGQVYYYKIARKGAVTGGIYNHIRHPQYLSLAVCGFGLLLLWPRYIVLLSFITILYGYFFLARIEEMECVRKFGDVYREYMSRTNMFLPFRAPFLNRLPGLPKFGVKRYLTILILYMTTSIAAVGVANGLKQWSLSSLYSFYSRNSANISLVMVEEGTLERILGIAAEYPGVQDLLKSSDRPTKFINYILPVKLYLSEIPMNPVNSSSGNHFLPRSYDRNFYKIIFTEAFVSDNREVEGKEILSKAFKITPVLEVHIDLSQNKVVAIKNPPKKSKYNDLPMPLF